MPSSSRECYVNGVRLAVCPPQLSTGPLAARRDRWGLYTWVSMSLVVHLPKELARRVETVAAERGVSPEQVVVDAVDAQLPARRRLGFIGLGHSGQGDLSERVKDLRTVVADERLADEHRTAQG